MKAQDLLAKAIRAAESAKVLLDRQDAHRSDFSFQPRRVRLRTGQGVKVGALRFAEHIRLFQRVIIPKPDYPKAFRFKTSCSLGIARSLLRMLPAIKLHNQLLFNADEINDVWWNRMLPPKFESAEVAVF